MEVRDPIHGFILLSDRERELLDLPVFQRLRRIKQLAWASLVYPGAVHTRFDHSLGALHVATEMARRLKVPAGEDQDVIRAAALLHDIGHGPFSHVSEFALEELSDRESSGIAPTKQIHEVLTTRIIEGEPRIAGILGSVIAERVVPLLAGEEGYGYQKGIISGPLDADKLDYLLRDSYFCGVKYGVFDLARLIRSLSFEPDGWDYSLVIDEDSVHSAEQYVLAKYYLTTQVYYHRIRLITDSMLKRAVLLGVKTDGITVLKDLYTYDPTSSEYVSNYVRWTDDLLTVELLKRDYCGKYAGKLFRCLVERRLWKRVFTREVRKLDAPRIQMALLGDVAPEARQEVELRIAEELRVNPAFVVLNTFSLKSVKEQTRNDEASLLVKAHGSVERFDEVSVLFASIDKGMSERHVQVYAPVVLPDDEAAKRRRLTEIDAAIYGILSDVFSDKGEEPRATQAP